MRFPATPSWGPLGAVVCGRLPLLAGSGVRCFATPGCGSWLRLPATPGRGLPFAVGCFVGGGVPCCVCLWCVWLRVVAVLWCLLCVCGVCVVGGVVWWCGVGVRWCAWLRVLLREGRLPPGIGHALPNPLDPAPLATHRDRALGLGHPHRPHASPGRPGHTTKPPPQTAVVPHLRVPRHPQGPQPCAS